MAVCQAITYDFRQSKALRSPKAVIQTKEFMQTKFIIQLSEVRPYNNKAEI